MLRRSAKRARPSTMDRFFWVTFGRFVDNWREILIALDPDTVVKYMRRDLKPPSQSWRTFLANHREAIADVDFFTVPTAMPNMNMP